MRQCLENDNWQRNFIETLLNIKDSFFIAEVNGSKYYNTNKGIISIYEDNYKFNVSLINIKSVKIDKFYKNANKETMKSITKNLMINFLKGGAI